MGTGLPSRLIFYDKQNKTVSASETEIGEQMKNQQNNYRTLAHKKQVPDSPGKRILQTRREMFFKFVGADVHSMYGWTKVFAAYSDFEIKRLNCQKGRIAIKRETLRKQAKSLSLTSSTCRITTPETVSADTKASDDGGGSEDPDQPEPPSPPGLAHLSTSTQLIIPATQRDRSSLSWHSAPGYCCLSGGGQR